jgi:hypothetical protein
MNENLQKQGLRSQLVELKSNMRVRQNASDNPKAPMEPNNPVDKPIGQFFKSLALLPTFRRIPDVEDNFAIEDDCDENGHDDGISDNHKNDHINGNYLAKSLEDFRDGETANALVGNEQLPRLPGDKRRAILAGLTTEAI